MQRSNTISCIQRRNKTTSSVEVAMGQTGQRSNGSEIKWVMGHKVMDYKYQYLMGHRIFRTACTVMKRMKFQVNVH